MSRIPVSGIMVSLVPELATPERPRLLEDLWRSERNSLTYKADYPLMAFRPARYEPREEGLIPETVMWLLNNQRRDGSFAPWLDHPVASDVFCTAIAALGLLQFPELSGKPALENGHRDRQIRTGEVGPPLNPPQGCRFHPRCPYATDLCKTMEPPLAEQEGRMVACHHALKITRGY